MLWRWQSMLFYYYYDGIMMLWWYCQCICLCALCNNRWTVLNRSISMELCVHCLFNWYHANAFKYIEPIPWCVCVYCHSARPVFLIPINKCSMSTIWWDNVLYSKSAFFYHTITLYSDQYAYNLKRHQFIVETCQ